MFKILENEINTNLAIYFINGYYDKVFKHAEKGDVSDLFYILLNKKYAIEIVVNYMDDNIIFYILKLDPDGGIDKSDFGMYSYKEGAFIGKWKREFLEIICENLGVEYNKDLFKNASLLNYQHNKNKDLIIDRINQYFKVFETFFKEYNKYLDDIDKL